MTIQDELRPNVIVRAIVKEDQTDCREIILSGLGEHFPEIDPSLNPDLDDFVTYYLESGHQFVVAVIGDRIVGTGGLLIEKQNEGRIVRLSVIREHRGLGIGQAVVKELLQRAKNRHLLQINVETNLDWYPAIGLYKRCGFRELYTDDESVHMVLDIRP